MKHALKIAAALIGMSVINVHADVTLTYEIKGPDKEPHMKLISIARFFSRLDDPAQPDTYLIYQAGKFFPLYEVDQSKGTYTRLSPEVKATLNAERAAKYAAAREQSQTTNPPATAPTATTPDQPPAAKPATAGTEASTPETKNAAPQNPPVTEAKTAQAKPAATPAAAKTSLRLTGQTKEVAGIECRIVEELKEEQPIMTHCMADKARLGITEREIRSLARTYQMARERDLGLLGTATKDEKFVSVASQDLQTKQTMELQHLSTKPLPAGYLRIPMGYIKQPTP